MCCHLSSLVTVRGDSALSIREVAANLPPPRSLQPQERTKEVLNRAETVFLPSLRELAGPRGAGGEMVTERLEELHALVRSHLGPTLRAQGLTAAQYRVLLSLAGSPADSGRELARTLGVRHQTMQRMLDQLQRYELIERFDPSRPGLARSVRLPFPRAPRNRPEALSTALRRGFRRLARSPVPTAGATAWAAGPTCGRRAAGPARSARRRPRPATRSRPDRRTR